MKKFTVPKITFRGTSKVAYIDNETPIFRGKDHEIYAGDKFVGRNGKVSSMRGQRAPYVFTPINGNESVALTVTNSTHPVKVETLEDSYQVKDRQIILESNAYMKIADFKFDLKLIDNGQHESEKMTQEDNDEESERVFPELYEDKNEQKDSLNDGPSVFPELDEDEDKDEEKDSLNDGWSLSL